MLPTHAQIASHGGYEIHQRQPGFEFTPSLLGKIASFLLRDPDGRLASVAFMYSFLIQLDDPTTHEERLLAEALETIKGTIDQQMVTDRYEATFEYRDGTWVEVSDPRWWIPTFR
jgi:hypothetical protein